MSGPMIDEQAPGMVDGAGGTAPGGTAPPAHPAASPPGPGGTGTAPSFPSVASAAADPARWGRVDDDGTVYVRTGDGERPVGS